LRAAEQQRADVARARRLREQSLFDPARPVFIDETSANTKMVQPYGRCARGERLLELTCPIASILSTKCLDAARAAINERPRSIGTPVPDRRNPQQASYASPTRTELPSLMIL
jgi:hypothetical protein